MEQHHRDNNHTDKLWIGLAVGAAIGIGIALSRRKRDRWSAAKHLTDRVANRSGELADMSKNLVDRVRIIYEESRKLIDDATDIWSHGRKMVGA